MPMGFLAAHVHPLWKIHFGVSEPKTSNSENQKIKSVLMEIGHKTFSEGCQKLTCVLNALKCSK
jgi:hypothetical protein